MSNNQTVETVSSTSDKIKIGLAILAVILGIVVYYVLGGDDSPIHSQWLRMGVFLLFVLLGAFLFWLSDTGKRVVKFGHGSYQELRRVVWPTRKETVQTTGIVFAFVAIMALFLWIVDRLIEFIVYSHFLGW